MNVIKKYDQLSFLDKCGCYNCRKIFSTSLITETTNDDVDVEVAICPFCDQPTVIADTENNITEVTLDEIKKTEHN